LLFVDRTLIGTGVGRVLSSDILRRAEALGARLLGVGAEFRTLV
jgi:GNAT superfamily N-acetyltransferase